ATTACVTFFYNQVNNIYVKKINCNIPFHSSYVAFVESQLLLSLNKIIPCPKKRSSKWISTSIPRTKWFTSTSKLSSADYHTRSSLPLNVTNLVLTRRTEKNINIILQGLGNLYNCGLQPQVANLYPSVEFPVSRGTPMISPSIR
ncbi:Fatty acid synthase, partial [Trachymyrmex cornetzi]